MRDPVFFSLLSALDRAPSAPLSAVDPQHLAEARARVVAARRLLGNAVQESAYLAFAGRLVTTVKPVEPTLAASA